ncbi:MAG: glycosyltransferase [Gammaproteobacteria bacterium]|nr:glycosyltransferase [Gammaproteobacteria bacterium]
MDAEAKPQKKSQTTGGPVGKVVFFMPIGAHEQVRAVHKQAWTLSSAGYEVEIAVQAAPLNEYLGMKVSEVGPSKGYMLRSLLNSRRWFRICRSKKADVFVLRNPDCIFLALMLTMAGQNVVYDSQEDFSKRPLLRGIRPAFLKPIIAQTLTFLEQLLARRVAAVLVTQAQQVEQLGGRTFLQPNAPLVDGPILDAMCNMPRVVAPDRDTLIYVGEISESRGIWQMLDIVERVNESRYCTLKIAGRFAHADLQREAKDHPGWQYVDYVGQISHAESLSLIRDADVGLALLMPVADYPTSSITKLYEYMTFGIPFVASNFPAWRVASENGVPGIYVDPQSPDESLEAIIRLLEDPKLRRKMGEIGSEYIANEFNWNEYANPFLEIIAAAQSGAWRTPHE